MPPRPASQRTTVPRRRKRSPKDFLSGRLYALVLVVGLALTAFGVGIKYDLIQLSDRTPVINEEEMALDIPLEEWQALPVEDEAPPEPSAASRTGIELVASSATRKAAMKTALSKVGAPYRYGAAGPRAFDCSGLVNYAYKSNGKKDLPRTSRALSRTGTPVSKGNLQPGDLVFFYKPVGHVGIYLGDNKMVHAPNRKSSVKVVDMTWHWKKFNTARRL